MEPARQIETFKEFFDAVYELELLEAIATDKNFFVAEFSKLAAYSPDLAHDLLEDPENVLRTAVIAAEQVATKHQGTEKAIDIEVRFKNLPASSRVAVGTLRAKELKKLIQVRGIVRQKSDVRPQVVSSKFECPSCGSIIPVLQVDAKFREPTRCSCGRKGQFREISKNLVDAQKIVLEEASDELDGSEQPKRLNIILKKDLVSPLSDRRTNPGSKIEVVGYLNEIPILLPQGQGRSTRFDIMMECLWVEPVEEEFGQITISPAEVEQIRDMGNDPRVYEKLLESVAPSIYGHERVKEALVLQMLGGIKKIRPDGVTTRGDMHVLLIGDPGSGKCFVGDTLVQLGDGTIAPIAEVFTKHQGAPKGEHAFAPTGTLSVASMEGHGISECRAVDTVWQRTEEKSLLRITTQRGDVLTLTQDHPLFIAADGYATAIPANDVTKDMWLAVPRIVRVEGSLQSLPQAVAAKAPNSIAIQTPAVLNTDLARYLGYLAGDGWIQKRATGQPASMLSFTNAEPMVLGDFKSIIQRQFGLEANERKRSNETHEVYTTNASLRAWIGCIAPELIANAGEKSVPVVVMRSPLDTVSAFIKALFECDAHVTKNVRTVQYWTKSHHMAREVRMLLLRFGIRSSLLTKWKRATNADHTGDTYYEVHISGSAVDHYAECIGFVSARKRSAFATHTSEHNTNVDVMPSVGKILRALRLKYKKTLTDVGLPTGSLRHYERGDRNPSRDALLKLLRAYPAEDPLVHQLEVFAGSEIAWEQVSKIEVLAARPVAVYDFEVKETHNFVAECVTVHNSQLLRRITKVAPKARFVSGKGASAAGLTASVVKDEFLRGYALEAGALVLANKGFACIDELDKMSPDDRSAFHEALEQQCYHYDTELMLANGSVHKIGEVVENLIAENADKVMQGVNCEILPAQLSVLTTNNNTIFAVKTKNVSRHIAPDHFIRIHYSNGRSLTVTPEHPVFVYLAGTATMRADAVQPGMLAPAPRRLKTKPQETDLTAEHGALLGYLASEGHSYLHPNGTYAEIGVCNTEPAVLSEMRSLFDLFGVPVNENVRPIGGKATLELVTLRVSSLAVYSWYKQTFPELAKKASLKRAGNLLRTAPIPIVQEFLRTAFHGDGFVTDTRYGYCTSSYDLAKDYQDLLLRIEAYSYIATEVREDGTYYKVVLSSAQSMQQLSDLVRTDRRSSEIQQLIHQSKQKNNDRDIVPLALVKRLDTLLRTFRANDGYFYKIIKNQQRCHRETFRKYCAVLEQAFLNANTRTSCISISAIAKAMDVSVGTISNIRAKKEHSQQPEYKHTYSALMSHEITKAKESLDEFRSFLDGDLRFVEVTRVETVPNTNQKWVYDVQVDDTHAFISEGLVLHNTVTISKANIQATLRCETVVLAAANPKYGRFDPYEQLAKQIDLPSTLINRFDLIFPIKDKPNKARDEEMANFILTMHQSKGVVDVPYTTDLLKKYIAYARQHCVPVLSQGALEEIKKFYVTLRSSGNESEMQSIPISARQLEGLVRLAEASAKSRLSNVITTEDSKKAIDLVYYCLTQIGIDPNTGKLDIDRASGIMPASERNAISQMREIIKGLSETTGESLISEEDIMEEARLRGVDPRKAEEALEKLNQKGDIFRPRHGFYSMMK